VLEALLNIWSDPNLLMVIAGTMLVGITAGVLGSFTLLQRKALIGDGVAHAILPGVILAYMLTGDKEPWVLFLGSFVAGWLSLWTMDQISRRTTLTPDTAVGVVLSVFFGLGVMLLGVVQGQETGNQSGLDKFLFGQAASLLPRDVFFLSVVCIIVLGFVSLAFKELRVRTFDPQFAQSLGYDRPFFRYAETGLLVIVLTTGLQAVGVILMAAVLIIPAATARYWTDRFGPMLIYAAVFGAFAAFTGSLVSYTAPRMPTGPWMVITSAFVLFVSMLISPKYGLLSSYYKRRRQSRRIDEDHLIKVMWMMRERSPEQSGFTLAHIAEHRPTDPLKLEETFDRLRKRGWIKAEEGRLHHWRLAKPGRDEARRLVRVHRLWETYLTQLLSIADDHVHEDADSMEHVITPEIEALLIQKLGAPLKDPHLSDIPYGKEGEV
jgi:manganese/zinc/iron transport system permease protein